MVVRPPVLTPDKKLSDKVKYVIRDRVDNIVGVVFSDEEKLIIEFFDRIAPIIVFDKRTKEFIFDAEIYEKDPKPVLNRLLNVK
jgi:folate-dependent tRNA-U54 methylase TrmFO/GidA